jgi:hypothetical protein
VDIHGSSIPKHGGQVVHAGKLFSKRAGYIHYGKDAPDSVIQGNGLTAGPVPRTDQGTSPNASALSGRETGFARRCWPVETGFPLNA